MLNPHLTQRLAFRPPRPPSDALAPVPLGMKGGRPYERRLNAFLERAWPVVREALTGVAHELAGAVRERVLCCGMSEDDAESVEWLVSEEHLANTLAAHIFDRGSEQRPADDNRREAEAQWLAVEHKLASIMTIRGLDLDLACAQVGLTLEAVRLRVNKDPLMAERLELAWLRGTAKLHGKVWDMAMGGREKSALALLQARDPRYQQTVKVEVSEQQIMSSPHFLGVVERLVGAFSVSVPDGRGEEYRAGWAEGVDAVRVKVQEVVG